MPEKVVIIGSGPAGWSAAIYAARANLEPLLFEGTFKPEMIPLGQLAMTTEVENYPGFAEIVQGPWLMEQMHAQAENCGTTMIQDHIKEVNLKEKP